MPNLPYRTHIAYYLGRKTENPETELLDRIICFFTRSKYSHVELVYDYSPVSQIGLCASSSSRDGGVRQTRIDFSTGRWELYEIPTTKTKDQIIDWFDMRGNCQYDWAGALGAYIERINGKDKRYFCVEAVGECLDIPGASKMTPEEFWQFNNLLGQRQIL